MIWNLLHSMREQMAFGCTYNGDNGLSWEVEWVG
jgi:hypothetical protein